MCLNRCLAILNCARYTWISNTYSCLSLLAQRLVTNYVLAILRVEVAGLKSFTWSWGEAKSFGTSMFYQFVAPTPPMFNDQSLGALNVLIVAMKETYLYHYQILLYFSKCPGS